MTIREIPASEAIARATSSTTVLIDVREQDEWDRGRSPLARLMPMSSIGPQFDGLSKDEPIIVVCHSGQRSARVAGALDDAGFDAVSVVGGMVAWNAAGGDIVADGDQTPNVD